MNKMIIKLTEQDLHRIVKESVNRILMESSGMPQISWKYDGTEVYLNGLYAGYIDPIGQIGGWYGKVNCIKDGIPTMETFGVSYDKTEIQQQITDFINKNYDNVLESCENIARLNNR